MPQQKTFRPSLDRSQTVWASASMVPLLHRWAPSLALCAFTMGACVDPRFILRTTVDHPERTSS